MKVFISWSGERSRAVADSLRYWLPKVIQAVQPWMSANDIEKGTQWRAGLTDELEQSSMGIICLTPESLESNWIHFEAGALSKQQRTTRVCTFLYELNPSDVREPLAQFQSTKAQEDDVRKLIHTINNKLGEGQLSDSGINEAFDVWWPKLEQRLTSIPKPSQAIKPPRNEREILEEILELIRSQTRTEQTLLNEKRLVKFRMPNAINLPVEDVDLLSNYYQGLQIDQQGAFKEMERLRTDEQYALKCLRTLRGKDGYVDKEWPSRPMIRKVFDELGSSQNSTSLENEDKFYEDPDS